MIRGPVDNGHSRAPGLAAWHPMAPAPWYALDPAMPVLLRPDGVVQVG